MPCRKRQWAKRPLEREDWLLRPSRATDRQKRLWASLLARLAERRLHELGARQGGWQADDNPIPPISAHGKSLLAAYRGRPLRACRDIGTGTAIQGCLLGNGPQTVGRAGNACLPSCGGDHFLSAGQAQTGSGQLAKVPVRQPD